MTRTQHVDRTRIRTEAHAYMDGVTKSIVPGRTPDWPNRRAVRRWVALEHAHMVHTFAISFGLSEHAIRSIVGGPKPDQDAASDSF